MACSHGHPGLAHFRRSQSWRERRHPPADIDHAIKRATARADSKVLSATVVDAIAQNPQLLSEIIRTASRAAPAYSIVIARDAAAAFPAFAAQIAAAASHSTPEAASTINAVTQLSSGRKVAPRPA